MRATPPLLALCEGKRARPRRAPTIRPKEHVLHIAVAKLLRDHLLPDWIFFHPANGERRDIRTAAKLKAMGVTPGTPDLVLISPSGSVRFLELKRIGDGLSELQDKFWRHCIRAGIPYRVARNNDEALAALDSWRCLRIALPRSDL